jgi:uncharacterized protein YkwD
MRPRAPGLAAVAALAAVLPSAAPASAQTSACPIPVAASPSAETAIADMIDSARSARDLPPLRMQAAIRAAGRRWSLHMSATGDFRHTGLEWAGNRSAGENISIAPTPRANFVAQMNSPPHRRNLLTRAWRFVGVGAARCGGDLFVTVALMR